MKQLKTSNFWHAIPVQDAIRNLQSDADKGLHLQQVEENRQKFGYNEIPNTEARKWYTILLGQFKSLLIWILLLAALISYIAGHTIDLYIILVIITINVIIAFFQEMKAERSVASLKSMVVLMAKVMRDGQRHVVNARELVPGDIVVLEEGDNVPADIRLIDAKNFRTIEASLTGESLPIRKEGNMISAETVLADRTNMLWKGTFVAGGFATGLVVATGEQTVLGEIAQSMTDIKQHKTHFHKKIDLLAKQMATIAIASATVMFLIGYFLRGMGIETLLFTSIAMLVSAIPESLPAIVSIVLAIGTQRMAKRNVIIREFSAIETLGAVTTIVTDKTGTLTQNVLTVVQFRSGFEDAFATTGLGWSPHGDITGMDETADKQNGAYQMLMAIAGFSNNAAIKEKEGSYELIGDPTEGALLALSRKSGYYEKLSPSISRLDDLPFDSKIKMRATLVDWSGRRTLFVIGAPEMVLKLSNRRMSRDHVISIDQIERGEINQEIENWSGNAMRVIALAYKNLPQEIDTIHTADIHDLVFAGITGMIDPPRLDVKEAVDTCHRAGINVIMATGDHAKTGLAIARATGIVPQDAHDEMVLTEGELLGMTDNEFDRAVSSCRVFARLTPTMKLRIASRIQAKGELIAMTGDGVNDAPALKKADVGIAMGIMGTDVARDASKMVLADDRFSTIVNAIEEGRIVFNNTRQTTYYLLTTNFAEITTLLTAMAIALPTPLTAIQILWLNLVTDGVNDMALSTEQGHGDELDTKPVKKNTGIVTKAVLPFLIINAGIMTVLSLGIFHYYLAYGLNKARTMAFITMAFCQLWNVLNMRSLRKSLFQIGPFTNRYIVYSLTGSIIVQLIAVETPFFEKLFGFEFVTPVEYVIVVLMTASVFVFGELYKYLKYGKYVGKKI